MDYVQTEYTLHGRIHRVARAAFTFLKNSFLNYHTIGIVIIQVESNPS